MEKNKYISLISSLSVLLIAIFVIGIFLYREYSLWYKGNIELEKCISSYSIWYNIFGSRIGSMMAIISPIIIILGAMQPLLIELNSGIHKYIMMRKEYNKYIINEIIKSYVTSLFIFPLMFILVLILCLILFPNNINELNISSLCYFQSSHVLRPLEYVFSQTLLVFLYSILMINFGIITMRFVKKTPLVLVGSFLVINFFNLFVNSILLIFKDTDLFNIYNAFLTQRMDYIGITFLIIIIYIIITWIVIYFLYRKKDKLVNNRDI